MMSGKAMSCVAVAFSGYLWLTYVKRGPIYQSDKSLEGKTVLITGGNNGIGKAIAVEFAKRNARVIIASRNMEKSQRAKQEIRKETGNDLIRSMYLDLIDFDSVRSFVKEFDKSEQYLDFLINNAGAMHVPGKTDAGINKIFAMNHLGPLLLTNLLLDKMKSQSDKRPVRIINLSSVVYRLGNLTEDVMYKNVTSDQEMYKYYATSKLANIYFTSELHRRLKEYKITTYSNHPGIIRTNIGDNFSLPAKILRFPLILLARNPYYGAQTTMYCALDDDVVQYSGHYFSSCKKEELLPFAVNETMENLLWEESLRLTGLVKS